MAITRWQPFGGMERLEPWREMESLRREMDRLFERLMPNREQSVLSPIPKAEMTETDDEINLRIEVPGMEAKDLDVEVSEDAVTVRGERKSETKTENNGMTRSEFHYGKLERVIPLPVRVQADKVESKFKSGILTLTLPKAEAEKRKAVKIKLD